MPIRRFFDWSEPFIPTVARVVVQDALEGATTQAPKELDLGRFTFVVTSGVAQRALEACLQQEAENAVKTGLARPDWTPPECVRLGYAPERLYAQRRALAEPLTQLYAQRRALETFLETDPRAATLAPKSLDYNSKDDAVIELAQTFLTLDQQLANDRRSYADVANACVKREASEEAERWRALDALHALYLEEIDKLGFADKNDARENALRRRDVGETARDYYNGAPRLYRVLGAVDLERQQLDFFNAIDERVEYWIYAPESEAERFDEFGRVKPEAWTEFSADIREENIFHVDKPGDQGEAVALLVKELSKTRDEQGNWRYERVDPEQITIGLPDDAVAPFVEEQTSAIDYAVHRAEGDDVRQNRGFRLLANVVDYLEKRSFDALGELLRRPDLEAFLERKWRFVRFEDAASELNARNQETLEEAFERETREMEEFEREEADAELGDEPNSSGSCRRPDYLQDFDDYRARFLPTFVPEKWLAHYDPDSSKRSRSYYDLRKAVFILDGALAEFRNDEQGRLVRRASGGDATKFNLQDAENARKLAQNNDQGFNRDEFGEQSLITTNLLRRPVREWCKPLNDFLRNIYCVDGEIAATQREVAAQIKEFVKLFNEQLNSLDAIKSDERLASPTVIRMILKQIASKRIPPLPGEKSIEIQGWLDLLFDVAPYLILTGFNEGVVPYVRAADLFLPNETRRALGMRDAQLTVARDAYLTRALAASKRAFFVVCGKRTINDDPLAPSRFLFAVEPDDVPKRALRFFSSNGDDDLERLRALQENRAFPRRKQDPNDQAAEPQAPRLELSAQANTQKDFAPPVLILPGRRAPDKMKVTEFKQFLVSPYRYFLSYAYNLRAVPTTSLGELNPAEFGTLAHDVVRSFGNEPEINGSMNFQKINAWLSNRLDEIVKERYYEHSSPFLFVQCELIRSQLRNFAEWQAKWRAEGNEIRFVETGPEKGVLLDPGDGEPISIIGRIDRIDYSKEKKRWYVFDYKTYDNPARGPANEDEGVDYGGVAGLFTAKKGYGRNKGNEVHLRHCATNKPKLENPDEFCRRYALKLDGAALQSVENYRWRDLQLPLYRLLVEQLLRERNLWSQDDKYSLGYVCICNGEENKITPALGARWDESDLRYAYETAKWIVRSIRRVWASGRLDPKEEFIPEWELATALPEFSSRFEDEFAPITLSGVKN